MRTWCVKFLAIAAIIILGIITISCISLSGINAVITIASGEIDSLEPNPPLTMTKEYKGDNKCNLCYKLCDVLPIKRVVADIANDEVYLGGHPLGIDMRVNGLIVSEITRVVTRDGVKIPLENKNVKQGDLLTHINALNIRSMSDVASALDNCNNNIVILTLERDGKIIHEPVTPVIDSLSNKKKIGLFLREGIQGIGTLTYVNPKTGRYGALGHVIKDAESNKVFTDPNGMICNAKIFDVVKGERGKAGELSGAFDMHGGNIGTIDKNGDQGIFGKWSGNTESLKKVKVGSKYSVHPGKATIYTTIDGCEPKEYDIEIIKNAMQNSPKTKGLLLRVTDKELLTKCGGIVQGMSGSPIMQDGKLVGAVTHVFINDPKKGYGTYIDFMLPN